jgi:cytochrome c
MSLPISSYELRTVARRAVCLLLPFATAAGLAASMPGAAIAQSGEAAAATMVSSYTTEQAGRGKKAYKDDCAECHGGTLGGGGEIPGVVGHAFRERWFVGSADKFMSFITENMPQQDPGSLDPQTYADIAAFLMSHNHVPAGDTEFPGDPDAWPKITLPPLN